MRRPLAFSLAALSAGAVAIITKPKLGLKQFLNDASDDLLSAVKSAARQEVYETFATLLRENGRLGELLSADRVVINALLALPWTWPRKMHSSKLALPLAPSAKPM